MTNGSLTAWDQLSTWLYLIMIVLIVQTRDGDNIWLGSDQGTDVDILVQTLMVKVASVWLTDILYLVDVMTNEKCGELKSVEAMLGVCVNVTGESKSVLRRWLGVTFEDDPCPPFISMVSTMVAGLSLLILNHNFTFLIDKWT